MNSKQEKLKQILFFILISFSLVRETDAQDSNTLSGKIVDEVTGDGIPYSTIELYGAELGTASDKGGIFKLRVPISIDSVELRISALAYEKKYVSLSEVSFVKENLIKLKARTIVLPELVIRPGEGKVKNFRTGNLNKKNIAGYSSGIGIQVAIFMENQKNVRGYISSVSYFITKYGKPETPFRIRIYDFDSVQKGPGKDLLLKNLIVSAKKTGWFQIDMTKYNIQIPANGFFCCNGMDRNQSGILL